MSILCTPHPQNNLKLVRDSEPLVLDLSSGLFTGAAALIFEHQYDQATALIPCFAREALQLSIALGDSLLTLHKLNHNHESGLLDPGPPIHFPSRHSFLAESHFPVSFDSTEKRSATYPIECDFTPTALRHQLQNFLESGEQYLVKWRNPVNLVWMVSEPESPWLPDEYPEEFMEEAETLQYTYDEELFQGGPPPKPYFYASTLFHQLLVTGDSSNFKIPNAELHDFYSVNCSGELIIKTVASPRPRLDLEFGLPRKLDRVLPDTPIHITLTNRSATPITIWFPLLAPLPYAERSLSDAFEVRNRVREPPVEVIFPAKQQGPVVRIVELPQDPGGKQFVELIPGVPTTILRHWTTDETDRLFFSIVGPYPVTEAPFELKLKEESLRGWTTWREGTRTQTMTINTVSHWMNKPELDINVVGSRICVFNLVT